jgi:hypothetical protein
MDHGPLGDIWSVTHAEVFFFLTAFSDGDGELAVLLFFLSVGWATPRSTHDRVLSFSPVGHCALRRRAWVVDPLARIRDLVLVGGERVRGVIDGMVVVVRSPGRWGVDIGLGSVGIVSGEDWWSLRGIKLLGGAGLASDVSSWARVGQYVL